MALRSKLDSKAAPPILHLDTYLQEESPNTPPFPTSSSGTQISTDPSASSQKSQEPWSLLTALINEIQTLQTQDGIETVGKSPSELPSSRIASSDALTWDATSDDLTFAESGKLTSSPMQSTTVVQLVTVGDRTETTAQPRQTALKPLSLHRKYRSLLRKRQISGPSGKSMWHTLL